LKKAFVASECRPGARAGLICGGAGIRVALVAIVFAAAALTFTLYLARRGPEQVDGIPRDPSVQADLRGGTSEPREILRAQLWFVRRRGR
jgi:hypothetical protein